MERNKLAIIIAILFSVSVILGLWIVLSNPAEKGEGKTITTASQDKIAVVDILGPITASMNASDLFSSASARNVKRFRQINENPSIKAVVLRINSPGGTVGAVQEIYSEVLKLRKNGKFVVASFSDLAASGGYYVACAADRIVSEPGTLTGSIGVILEVGNFSELMRKIGVRIEAIKSGKHKDIGSFSREMTPAERKILQGLINNAYEQFLSAVMTGRNLKEAKARALADGRIFTGEQAKAEGLVDSLGGMDEAVEEAKKLAGLKGEVKIIMDEDQWNKIFDFIPGNFGDKTISKILETKNVRFEYSME